MANKAKQRGKWDAVIGLALTGFAVLLAVALISYHPGDLPSWALLIYDGTAKSPIVHNLCGVVGAVAAGYLYFFFGGAAWLWIIVLAGYGIAKLTTRDFALRERAGWSFLFVLSGACLLQLQPWVFGDWKARFHIEGPGGWFGKWVGEKALGGPLGEVGAPIVLGVIYLTSLVLAIGFHPVSVLRRGYMRVKNHFATREKRRLEAMEETERMEAEQRKLAKQAEKLERKLKKKPEPAPAPAPGAAERSDLPEPEIIDSTVPPEKRPSLAEIEQARRKKSESKPNLGGLHLENYELPPLSLLDPIDEAGRRPADHDELRGIQNTILETLAHFGIEATAGPITHGPTITRYEVVPKSGVRVDRIAALERDIARATRAQRINILAPIPGKDTVGIEIANASKVKVTLRELLETEDWLHSGAKLPLALGKDVYGKTIIADLAKMPHCLVAGTTGSGKSVCINSIIASLLYRYTPEELRFIMIDPKVVEMQIYNGLPHLVTPVVTDPKKVLLALRWVVEEMEYRYQVFAKAGVRNVTSFNERPLPKSQKELDEEAAAAAPPPEETEPPAEGEPTETEAEDEEPEPAPKISVRRDDEIIIPDRMPYIVVIIDELADLMQTAPADVEGAIARITQMARAAGIHLIVATQTPRADVVTGIIKANIPSRIAFQVASGLDSRVILDQKGAEKLLGQGDMLYLPPASSQLLRSQGVLVTDEEIRVLVEFVSAQAKPKFESSIQEKLNSDTPAEEDVTDEDEELVQKVLDIMRQERRASTSLFQRRLRLGYTRAARIVDILEQRGIVGPRDGAKDREILVSLDTLD